ncbi:MAG: glutamine-hydrolyzing GMP synthase [Nitrospirota bacterium]
MNIEQNKVLILDFGSQYTQLIARRVRESKVYCEIYGYNASIDKIRAFSPDGIILSGSPSSVYDKDAPICDKRVFELKIPVLGICYGMQVMTYLLGGKVAKALKREYGRADIIIDDEGDLFKGIRASGGGQAADNSNVAWMSHGDKIEKMPHGFISIAHTANSPIASMKDPERKFYSLQFHPEVVHTDSGIKIIQNFLYEICRCNPVWTMSSFMKFTINDIREKVGDGRVICALSGGVDSSVAAVIVNKAIGKNLLCVFVDNGLLRKDEAKKVIDTFKNNLKLNVKQVNAAARFLNRLKGVVDPEKKRKIIGREFIKIFEEEAGKFKGHGDAEYLVQGTLYPDVIESVSFKGPSSTIKSHHNVGGLPSRMRFKLIEPLRELFKDEVRRLGSELGISDSILWRWPFPGPGLAVRIIGEVTNKRCAVLRETDAIVEEEILREGLYRDIWQAFTVLLPIKTVGVMGDERTYENVLAVRAVTSLDGMTADWVKLPYNLLEKISNRIINEVMGINRVVYDISSKPPSTIEWE